MLENKQQDDDENPLLNMTTDFEHQCQEVRRRLKEESKIRYFTKATSLWLYNNFHLFVISFVLLVSIFN